MADINARIFAGQWKLYKPRIRAILDRGESLPFTGLWITARYSEGTPIKHTPSEMAAAIDECRAMDIEAHPGLAILPPREWNNRPEWERRDSFLKTFPDWLQYFTLTLDLENHAGGGEPGFGRHAAIQPFIETTRKFQEVITYPCAGSYAHLGGLLRASYMADEPFPFCRQLMGQTVPRRVSVQKMVDWVGKARLAVEAQGAEYMPGTLDTLHRFSNYKAAVKWLGVNRAGGVNFTGPWFMFLDDKDNWLL